MATEVKLRLRQEGADQVRRDVDRVNTSLADLGDKAGGLAAAGLATMTAAATAALAAVDGLLKKAGDFQDLAEKTSSSAEGLASLAVAAAVGGSSVNEAAAFANRLGKALVGVDDESKAAGAALEALGLNVAEFKRLDAADQLEALATALKGFDDAGKAQLMDSMAKGASSLLPFLKALGEEGGRQVILTREQIEAADAYADAQAKAKAQVSLYAQSVATEALPVITQTIEAFTGLAEGQELAAVASAILRGAMNVAVTGLQTIAVVGSDVGFVFLGVGRELGAIAAQLAALARLDFKGFSAISDAVREDALRARRELDAFQTRVMNIGQQAESDPDGAREMAKFARQAAGNKKRLNFNGAVKGGGAAGAGAGGSFNGLSYDEQISRKAGQLLEESDITRAKVYADTLARLDELYFAGGISGELYESAVKKLTGAHAAAGKEVDLLAMREKRLGELMAGSVGGQIKKQQEDMLLLTEALEKGKITTEEYLDAVTARLGIGGSGEAKQDSFALRLGESIEEGLLTGFRNGGTIVDVFLTELKAQFAKTVLRPVIEPMAAAGSAAINGIFSSLSSALFGGAFADGGDPPLNRISLVGERGPELFVPRTAGTIVPLDKGGLGGAPITVIQNFTVGDVPTMDMVRRAVHGSEQRIAAAFERRQRFGGA